MYLFWDVKESRLYNLNGSVELKQSCFTDIADSSKLIHFIGHGYYHSRVGDMRHSTDFALYENEAAIKLPTGASDRAFHWQPIIRHARPYGRLPTVPEAIWRYLQLNSRQADARGGEWNRGCS